MLVALGVLLAGTVAPINAGNALTLPAARHLVRMETGQGRPPAWLLAIQQDGANGHGLGFVRSDDDGSTWRYYAPIQNDRTERDTPDLVPVGNDIALVYSYEGPKLTASDRHDVYFQWWRWDGAADWRPSTPLRVFDSSSSTTAYYRALLAVDSEGRIWIQAFRLNTDGTHTAVITVSTDGGTTFTPQPSLATLSDRGGGRLISLGTRLMFLYGAHGCCETGKVRLRDDNDPLSSWSSATTVLPDGIYHGAALSAVADGAGGLHLAYKNLVAKLYYRHFDGTSWSSPTLLDGTVSWALQPAITRLGSDLVIFYNPMITDNTNYRFVYRTLHAGSLSSASTLDSSVSFKGYPASVDVLPLSTVNVPCIFGKTPDTNTVGSAVIVFGRAPNPGAPPPPPPPPPPPATDGGIPDAGTPPTAGLLFFDDFNRSDRTGLGPNWTVAAGAYITDGRANSALTAFDQAYVKGITCADCRIDARMVGFGTELALTLRGDPSAPQNRYDLVLTSGGRLRVRRWRGGSVTVLGDVASGLPYLTEFESFSFTVSGTAPVILTAALNGKVKLTVTDGNSAALTAAGVAGFTNLVAGNWVDDFTLTGLGGESGGVPDGGVPDAGTPDAGTPDAGVPDAGPPDGGAPDGGVGETVIFGDPLTGSGGLGSTWMVASGALARTATGTQPQAALSYAFANATAPDAQTVSVSLNIAASSRYNGVLARGVPAAPLGNHYAGYWNSDGTLWIARRNNWTYTYLASTRPIAPVGASHRIGLQTASTASGVELTLLLDGTAVLSIVDASAQRLVSPGRDGIFSYEGRGAVFAGFSLETP